MKSSRIYDFTIPANGSFQLNVEGDYVRVMTSTDALEIVTDNMRLGPLRAGQGQQNHEFRRLTLNDKSGATNVGTILVASSDFIDQRINGEVSVIDGGKARTLANNSFMGVLTYQAVPANFTTVGLANLAGSGKNVVIKAYRVAMTVTDFFFVGILPGTLTTDMNAIPSKLSGGAASSARHQYSATAGNLIATRWDQGQTAAGATTNIVLQEPIVIKPGSAFAITSSVQNNGISVAIEFNEEAS